MNLSQAVNRVVVPKGDANALRWSGQRGHYEVYYLTLNHRAEKLALWLRYTMDAPLGAPAFCELWAHAFDPSPDKSFGLKDRFPIDLLRRPEGALISVDKATLKEGAASGSIAGKGHALSWDLSFSPSQTAIHAAPFPMRALSLVSTNMIFANQDVRFSGQIILDGRVIAFDHEPGCQTHLWGKKHAERWAWGHCNAFDGREDCSLDGASVWTKRLGRTVGPLSGLYLRYRGRDYCLNAVERLFFVKSAVSFPSWRFEGSAGGLTFVGTFRAVPSQFMQVLYEDPDGERSWCANTEVADLSLEVLEGSRRVDLLTATGTAHVEFGDRQRREEVRATV